MLRTLFFGTSLALCSWACAAPVKTVDFDTLTHPDSGVGPAVRVYQEAGPGGFTLLRIPVDGDASSLGNHFHTVAGNGSLGHSNHTAAQFFSDDGSPFLYFLGNYTGNSASTYAPDWSSARNFALLSFTVLQLEGVYQLKASNGAVITIDHVGTYSGPSVAAFKNILWYRHDYVAPDLGWMVVDDIKVVQSPQLIGPLGG